MNCLIAVFLAASVCRAINAADWEINFNRDVRLILSDKCFRCHGPDEAAREAEPRLDDEKPVKEVRDGNVIVRPGDLAGSELIRRISSDDESEIMPPHESNKPLTEKEKQMLRQWVAEGAKWSQHWAYESPVRHAAGARRALHSSVSSWLGSSRQSST